MKTTSATLLALAGAVLAAPLEKRDTLQGFDVSGYQSSVDFAGAYASGARFVIIKATEGTTYTSDEFSTQYDGSYQAGFIRGAYHFAQPADASGADQANFFLQNGGGWSADGKTLPGMLDIEYGPDGNTCYGLGASDMVTWITDFVNTYQAATGRYPMIYSTLDWWSTCTGNVGSFGNCPLVLARYGDSVGDMPAGWAAQTIWQNNDAFAYGGDSDVFNGGMAELTALATG